MLCSFLCVYVCVWCVSMRMVVSLVHIPCILCNVLVTQIVSQTFLIIMSTLHVVLVLLRVVVVVLLLMLLL